MRLVLLSPTEPKTLSVDVTTQMTLMDTLSRPEVLAWLPPKVLLDNISASRTAEGTYLDLTRPLGEFMLAEGELIELFVQMTAASPSPLRSRADLDCEVLRRMDDGTTLSVEAFASLDAFLTPNSPSILESAPTEARYFRWRFGVETMVSDTESRPFTLIGVSTDVDNFPYAEPKIVALDDTPPWNPHFHPLGRQYCIGDEWQLSGGRMLLGHVARHIARILNWDEELREGYEGWNSPAAAAMRKRSGQPLRQGVQYPQLPIDYLLGDDGPA